MLGWFADEADPTPDCCPSVASPTHSGQHTGTPQDAPRRGTCGRIVGLIYANRYAADLLIRSPDSVSMLGEPGGLEPRSQEATTATMRAAASRRDSGADAILAVRAIRRNEVLRIVVADLAGGLDVLQVGAALTDLNAHARGLPRGGDGRGRAAKKGVPLGGDLLVVGMGSFGGVWARLGRRRHVRPPPTGR